MTGLCVILNVVSKKVIFTKVLDLIFDYFHKKYFNILWKMNKLDLIKNIIEVVVVVAKTLVQNLKI